jgi:septum formation inhibitor MinC
MANENIVAGLFGMTPDMYERQQYQQDLKRGYELAQLSPGAAAQAGLQASVGQLGRGFAGAMGVEDPQMKKMSQRNQLLQQLDVNDPESFVAVAKLAAGLGDGEFAVGLIEKAKSLGESQSKTALQQAQTLKALQPDKLTGDERYIQALRVVEAKLQRNEKPTATELSNANISGQMLSKPRSYLDQASGQMITQAATDPSKAFPLAYKEMGATTEGGATTVPKPTVQQATAGNIPAGSQKEIGDIQASLAKLENSAPELDSFLQSLKTEEVKFNATSNTLDLLGATVLPAFGFKEQGGQVKKDEIKRALTERVNTLLLMAKGTQTEGDAERAKDQIASTTTFLSQARMIGAIEGLQRAEKKLERELLAKRTSLQSQGRATEPSSEATAQETPLVATPTKQTTPSVAKPAATTGKMTKEQMINSTIEYQKNQFNRTITRAQAEQALRNAGKL